MHSGLTYLQYIGHKKTGSWFKVSAERPEKWGVELAKISGIVKSPFNITVVCIVISIYNAYKMDIKCIFNMFVLMINLHRTYIRTTHNMVVSFIHLANSDCLKDFECFNQSGPEVIKLFFMLNLEEHEIFPLLNVKMPTVVGISTFMGRKNSILGLAEPEKS